MSNPFDDEASFLVLVNSEGLYSLWPTFIGIPSGWTVDYRGGDRRACLEYVDDRWKDLRRRSDVSSTMQQMESK